ncbi:MAG: hypothetical protein LC749_13995 [Actinobacteria bacterium]|nr:hypothetical protein [Actinomycetota bacterium]
MKLQESATAMNEKVRKTTQPTQPTQPKKGKPIDIPIPKRKGIEALLTKAAKPRPKQP